MTRRLDEKKAAVHPCILDVPLTLCSELFAQVSRVLFFDISDYRIPATMAQWKSSNMFWALSPSIIIDLITITRSIDDIQSQTHSILLNDCSTDQYFYRLGHMHQRYHATWFVSPSLTVLGQLA